MPQTAPTAKRGRASRRPSYPFASKAWGLQAQGKTPAQVDQALKGQRRVAIPSKRA